MAPTVELSLEAAATGLGWSQPTLWVLHFYSLSHTVLLIAQYYTDHGPFKLSLTRYIVTENIDY